MEKDIKLTNEQLQQIESYLNNNDVKYIDLHLEVLDHISSDIENEMTINNSSFKEAFDKIRIKWSKTFSYKWTFWLGISNGGSKLFIDHCLKIYKPILIKAGATLLLFLTLTLFFYEKLEITLAPFQNVAKILFLVFSIIYVSLIFYWKHQINKAGKNTTYYYLYKKTVMPNIAITALFIFQVLVFNNPYFDVSIFMFSYVFLFNLYIGFNFYSKHTSTLKKYKML
jgi:hypothetical protein